MDKATFAQRLADAASPEMVAALTHDVIEDTLDLRPGSAELRLLPGRIDALLEKGLDPNIVVDGLLCIYDLQYGYTDIHLEAARRIFEKCGLPNGAAVRDHSFMNWIRMKLDYNYYNCAHIVKLYLLCAAYSTEETCLHMRENLYPEMFNPIDSYTSANDLPAGSEPLKLTPAIFKDIRKFDFCVEMLEPKEHPYGGWKLHIFEKESKIEVATYG